ncbi:MAG: type II secretion system GspH family protein [Lentisphaeraceae bacterium]|nr:type II secretion system GspH family protein [Lentisphaeraceae bacterium]
MLNRKSKFTLLELLVVVAIIGILLSLLLPSLSKAKDASKRVVCGSNYKQMYVGSMIYTNNNDKKLPRTRRARYNHYSWIWTVSQALDLDATANPSRANTDLFTCPKVPVSASMNTSYAYNIYCGSKKNGLARYDIVTLTKVSKLEEAWFIGEGVPPQFNTGLFSQIKNNENKLHGSTTQGILLDGAVKNINPHHAAATLNPSDPGSTYWASWADQNGQ